MGNELRRTSVRPVATSRGHRHRWLCQRGPAGVEESSECVCVCVRRTTFHLKRWWETSEGSRGEHPGLGPRDGGPLNTWVFTSTRNCSGPMSAGPGPGARADPGPPGFSRLLPAASWLSPNLHNCLSTALRHHTCIAGNSSKYDENVNHKWTYTRRE